MLDSTSPFCLEILTEEIRRPEVTDEPPDRRMSLWPVANRSFLHGDRRSFAPPEKIVYATLDSLALKRARLPLQLLPVRANVSADCDASLEDGEGNCEQQVRAEPVEPRLSELLGAGSSCGFLTHLHHSWKYAANFLHPRRLTP